MWLPGGIEGKRHRQLAWRLSIAVDPIGGTPIEAVH
jgi:hypothetical protein